MTQRTLPMSIQGVSVTLEGEERYEFFTSVNKKRYVQYDYRHEDGELFSCVATDLTACRFKRNIWLNEKMNNQHNKSNNNG